MTTEPTRGQRRCQIYRHVRRPTDACDHCDLSEVSCHANLYLYERPCCEDCAHPN